MTQRTNPYGLILRREAFGGIIFDAFDGTQLELDAEGFSLAESIARVGAIPDRGYARFFSGSILRQLPSYGKAVPNYFAIESFQSSVDLFASPTLVDFQITERCGQGCPHCYASSEEHGSEVVLDDALLAFDRFAEAGVCQVALGGGDPLLHSDISTLLKAVRERGMVPNVTTSGAYFSDANLCALKECCGAVALSLEAVGERFSQRRRMGFSAFTSALRRLGDMEIPAVLQVTVSLGNLDEIDNIVEFAMQHKLYGVVFLAFKPAGRGRFFDDPLANGDVASIARKLSNAFGRLSKQTRVGYDCCFAPMIAALDAHVYGHGNRELEGCSACRGSVGVTTSLDVVPCTFVPDKALGNLRNSSLLEIWRGEGCDSFRREIENHATAEVKCRTCDLRRQCLGGCSQFSIAKCSNFGSDAAFS